MNLIEKMLTSAIPYGEPVETKPVFSAQKPSINSSIDPNVLKKDIKDMDEEELVQMMAFVENCFKELEDEPVHLQPEKPVQKSLKRVNPFRIIN